MINKKEASVSNFDLQVIRIVTVCLDTLGVIFVVTIPLTIFSTQFLNSKWMINVAVTLLMILVFGVIFVGVPFVYIEGKYGYFPYNGIFNPIIEILGDKRK